MPSITITNLDDNYYELRQEFQKLASLVPTIPKDRCLSEVEFIEFVIAYIQQLQQLLFYDQQNEYVDKLTSSVKDSTLSSLPSSLIYFYKRLIHQSSRTQTNENVLTNHRRPLASINLDDKQLS